MCLGPGLEGLVHTSLFDLMKPKPNQTSNSQSGHFRKNPHHPHAHSHSSSLLATTLPCGANNRRGRGEVPSPAYSMTSFHRPSPSEPLISSLAKTHMGVVSINTSTSHENVKTFSASVTPVGHKRLVRPQKREISPASFEPNWEERDEDLRSNSSTEEQKTNYSTASPMSC